MLTAAPPLPRLRVLRERLFIQFKNAFADCYKEDALRTTAKGTAEDVLQTPLHYS